MTTALIELAGYISLVRSRLAMDMRGSCTKLGGLAMVSSSVVKKTRQLLVKINMF